MPTNVCTPVHMTGDLSFKAGAAVTGKRFVAPSADRTGGGTKGLSTDLQNAYVCSHAGAGIKAAGVAMYDTPINTMGGMYGTPGEVVPVTSGAAITAGAEVMSDANGKAIPLVPGTATNRANGLAMTSVAGTDLDVEIKLY
jgi:hypothetical protein